MVAEPLVVVVPQVVEVPQVLVVQQVEQKEMLKVEPKVLLVVLPVA